MSLVKKMKNEKNSGFSSNEIIQEEAAVIENQQLMPDFYRLVLRSSFVAAHAAPGQFVHIRPRQAGEPLLRRPFSVHRISGNDITVLYKVAGKGTTVLSRVNSGDYLDILGPLGNGFSRAEDTKTHLLVAGGMGVAPLRTLIDELIKQRDAFRISSSARRSGIHLLWGAQTEQSFLCLDEIKSLSINISLVTEDGTAGEKGMITDVLERILKSEELSQPLQVFACGPRAMLRVCAEIAGRYNVFCQVSLEEMMACGVGACLGCAVMTKNGYQRVCKEGPVFDAREIVWDRI